MLDCLSDSCWLRPFWSPEIRPKDRKGQGGQGGQGGSSVPGFTRDDSEESLADISDSEGAEGAEEALAGGPGDLGSYIVVMHSKVRRERVKGRE